MENKIKKPKVEKKIETKAVAKPKKDKTANKMREIDIERVILHCGGSGDKLDKGVKLLSVISGSKIMKTKSSKRIPALGVRPGLELGCMTTLRREKAKQLLKRLLVAVDNTLSRKQIRENHFSFGIKEYIEIPAMEFIREVGIAGLTVTVVFVRKGKRVERRKIKTGKIPKKQSVSAEEIIKYMEDKFNLKLKEKGEGNSR